MSEVKTVLVPYQVNYQCDACKAANISQNINHNSLAFAYYYTCPNCKAQCKLDKLYPYMVYE